MNDQVWNLTEILEQSRNHLLTMREEYQIRSNTILQMIDQIKSTINDVNYLRNLIANAKLRSETLSPLNTLYDILKENDPLNITKFDSLIQFQELCKMGIVLAKREGKEII